MSENHPITPTPELVQQWMHEASGQPPGPDARVIATQAARWGADTELEACVEWLWKHQYDIASVSIRAARRPKPPSLAQRALHILGSYGDLSPKEHDTIRKALEQLND